jgi:hypothetical protein
MDGGSSRPDRGRDGMTAWQQGGLEPAPLMPQPQVAVRSSGPGCPRPSWDQGATRKCGKPRQA